MILIVDDNEDLFANMKNVPNKQHSILIVDDNQELAFSLKDILENEGCHTAIANDGQTAINICREQEFDIGLIDIKLPDIQGIELIDKLSSLTPKTEYVIITGHASIDTALAAVRDNKILGYEQKPIDMDRFLTLFRQIIKRKNAEEALQKAHDELEQRIEERTTELWQTNECLKEIQQNLRIKANALEELNAALNVLLKKREEDKKVLEERILANVRTLIEPYIGNLKKSNLPQRQTTLLNILESNLNEIILPFTHRLSSKYLNLSPSEIQVANLVKQGKTNKEIAEILTVGIKTIGFHRGNIRKKLGLTKKKTNLRTYLMSID